MATTELTPEAFKAKICEILEQHHKMPMSNTIYNADRSIKDRDVTCYCGYKGHLKWSEHMIKVLEENDAFLITKDEWDELLMAKVRQL